MIVKTKTKKIYTVTIYEKDKNTIANLKKKLNGRMPCPDLLVFNILARNFGELVTFIQDFEVEAVKLAEKIDGIVNVIFTLHEDTAGEQAQDWTAFNTPGIE